MLGSQFNALSTSTINSTSNVHSAFPNDGSFEHERAIGSSLEKGESKDTVKISQESLAIASASNETRNSDPSQTKPDGQEYTPEEKKEIEKLEDRDQEVRRHEQAHFQAAGSYASPPKYEYQTGPDGKRYAVGGSVEIDMSEVTDDPQATLEKARVIKRAALAPEEPSAQDRKVAREADKMAAEAQKDINEQRLNASKSFNGEQPFFQTSNPTKPESNTRGDVASASGASATSTLEFADEVASNADVSQYRTSRLEFSSSNIYNVERLATPRSVDLYTPSRLSLDMYA